MKTRLLTALFCLLTLGSFQAKADEGMWIPMLLEQLNEKEMQDMGLRLSAEDIYSINHSSLKDAIVIFGNGCTGEIVSDKGLILTNHHCGFGSIQSHSSVEHDYLTDGFWAMNQKEELPNKGLTCTLLIRMNDVTEQVLEGVDESLSETDRKRAIDDNIKKLNKAAIEGTHYKARIKPFYYGNEYYQFITEVFQDIRLVGAPPSNIGKFGGDTDNWMWPRHTGDFSVFRIYTNSDNKPAKFDDNNRPYSPKNHLSVSLKGVEKDDFTFVFGYPGSTQEYLPSNAVEMITKDINPVKIKLRANRLDIMNQFMSQSPKVRIQYASKYAHVANGWKKWIGENRGIKRLKAIDKKQQLETDFQTWCQSNTKAGQKYAQLLPAFNTTYKELTPYNLATTYFMEAGLAVEAARFAYNFSRLGQFKKGKDLNEKDLEEQLKKLQDNSDQFFKDYHQPIDKKVLIQLLSTYYKEVDKAFQPEIFRMIETKYKGDFEAYADDFFKKTRFTNQEKVNDLLANYKPSSFKKITKDPAYQLYQSLIDLYRNDLYPYTSQLNARLDSLMRHYMKAQMEMQPEKRFYPDANFTLRVAYGKVADYSPRDAVHYNYFTTLDGIMEKENPDIYDYVVEERLKALWKQKDYGRYADKDGSLHVAFTGSNHTTGGNSGSPVLNADGELIGINFDRNWEGTMSDLMYDPDQCRNITLDIRYCLFVIDKFAGAGHLVEEMTLAQ